MPFRDVQPLHGRKLMRAGGVRYLEGAYILVTGDHLSVGIL